ncbi:TPA: glycosyl transferase family 1, partial [Staphylococcus aureus]
EVNGYLIPKNNEEILLQKVRYLLTHPNVQKEFSRQSKLSAQKYSKETLIEKWNNALVFLDTKKL